MFGLVFLPDDDPFMILTGIQHEIVRKYSTTDQINKYLQRFKKIDCNAIYDRIELQTRSKRDCAYKLKHNSKRDIEIHYLLKQRKKYADHRKSCADRHKARSACK